jgi:hypothetical protein
MSPPISPRPANQLESPVVVKDGTSCTVPSQLPGPTQVRWLVHGCDLSVELDYACYFDTDKMPTKLGALSESEKAVLAWLRLFQGRIIEAEDHWCVDRRAIAGAIAWEALFNKHWFQVRGLNRFAGIGKVHYFDNQNRQTTAEQTEKAGYLGEPRVRGYGERYRLLQRSGEAIKYIAAIMRADADVVRWYGGYPDDLTYWNPMALTTWFQSKTMEDLKKIYTKEKYPGHALVPGESKMGVWVSTHLDFLDDAVGTLPLCARPNPVKRMENTDIGDPDESDSEGEAEE